MWDSAPRSDRAVRASWAVAFVLLLSCGGHAAPDNAARCGDGNLDPSEQCDDGNGAGGDGCSASCRDERFGDLVVQWEFNAQEAGQDDPPTFVTDSCLDFVAPPSTTAYLHLRSTSGPSPVDVMSDCRPPPDRHMHQHNLLPLTIGMLPVGTYVFEADILRDAGGGTTEVISQPHTLTLTIPSGATLSPLPRVSVKTSDFVPVPTGTLYFTTLFGSAVAGGCSSTSPPTSAQRITLRDSTGAVVADHTDTGLETDGAAMEPCRWPASAADSQRIEALPSGRYTLTVEGLDTAGAVAFCRTSRVFVGAGSNNPTYAIVVPAAMACP